MFLEEVSVSLSTEDESSARDKLGRLTGEVIKSMQQGIKQGFLDWSPRLLLAMYSCEIQASSKSSISSILEISNTQQPKYLVVSTMSSPVAVDASSPSLSKKAPHSSPSSPSSPSPNHSASLKKSVREHQAPPHLNSSSKATRFWMKIRSGYPSQKTIWRT